VATNGNDTWSGKLPAPNLGKSDGPLASVSAAINASRQRAVGEAATILLRSGTFALAETLKLSPTDSSLTIAAFENEKPVLSGGRRITGWKNVRANLWQASIPEARDGKWVFRQLFINGERAIRARTPNTGYFRIQGASPQDKPVKLKFKAGDIKKEWAADGEVEVIALLAWADIRMQIRAVDDTNHVATLSGDPRPSNKENNAQYYIENAPDALDAPGEWYLDRKTGVVSYLAKPGDNLAQAEVIAPVLDDLIVISGDAAAKKPAEKITLCGLTFSHTDWTLGPKGHADTQAAVAQRGDIRAEFARDITIEDCTFIHLAGYAVELGRGAQHCRVVGNEMSDLGAGGVRVGEGTVRTDPFDAVNGHTITDNHIHRLGVVYPPAVGVFILQSGNNRVAHNHIHDLFYTAVSVGWTWGYRASPCSNNIVEWNHMHDIGQFLLSDMGAVYTLGPQPGTIVRNNLIHDVNAFTYGGWGLYPDEGSTGIVMENNIVYRCKNAGFHQHYGKENVIRNNIFAFNKENQLMRSRDEEHLSFFITNNIVLHDSGNLLGTSWKNNQYVIDHNLYWDTRAAGDVTKMKFSNATLDQWKARGHDTNSVIADPLFVDAAKFDFRLKPNSPALKLGFKPIDLTGVGVRPRATR
ncbi:MAG TPA: right-handed parallel beta-helix repeat-containing protein, partial [Chthoniobacterales bacterium]|nr:right-handed parallel beta-helix repeat-containing protein [Chthoniobacterales bacterium]